MLTDLPGSIGRYQVRRELGRGMMGVVYLAHDPDLGRDIALKVIQLPAGANEADRAAFEQRFFAEAQSAARLSHPGIVIVHDVGRDANSGALFMALQLLPGRTLDSILKEKQRLPHLEALRIARKVAEALQHAHLEGVVHRDIKPSNIMILPSGEPKIMDFGIAKIEASRLTATGQFVGTPLYMSPEQAMARPVDGRSDIFSLGSVLYEMLTGAAAFDGESVTKILYQLMSTDPEPPSSFLASLPPAIDNILRRCLAKELELRYRDAQTLALDISAIPGTADPPPAPRVPKGVGGTVAAQTAVGPVPGAGGEVSPDDWGNLETRTPSTGAHRPNSRRTAVIAGSLFLAVSAVALFATRPKTLPPVARLVNESTPTAEPEATKSETPKAETRPGTPEVKNRNPNEPARLVLDFEHSLKSGVLRFFVDDLLVMEQPFGGKVTRKIVGLEMRKGHLTQTVEIAPGLRNLRVQVSWEDNVKTERTQSFLSPGGRFRLKAKLGSFGGLRKDLSLEWN